LPQEPPAGDPKLRVLYVAASLLLVNAWVEMKWASLSTTRRGSGGRTVHEDLLPYERFLAIEVPRKRSAAGSKRGWFTNY